MSFTEEQKKAALLVPHNFVFVDQVVKLEADGFQAQVTLGWETPQGTLQPVITLAMPLPFASNLANKIAEELKSKKNEIAAQHKAIQSSI